MITDIQIQGECDTRFSAVKEAFAANFSERGDIGAAVSVYLGGASVVDIWAGYADGDRNRLFSGNHGGLPLRFPSKMSEINESHWK